MKEIWKDIPSYEGFYQVSNLGRVKSLQRKCKSKSGLRLVGEKIRKPNLKKTGYLQISLNKNGIKKHHRVHQLVAMAFLNHKPNNIQILLLRID